MKSAALAILPLFGIALTIVACGARSEIAAPEVAEDSGEGGSGGTATTPRSCAPNCTIGHRCCVGGCSGPAAATENDCCECLDGEVNSSNCPAAVCGGGACKLLNVTCATDEECCSQHCDYPGAGANKKNCLP